MSRHAREDAAPWRFPLDSAFDPYRFLRTTGLHSGGGLQGISILTRMNRRTFLRHTGLATGSLLLPVWGRAVSAFGETAPLPAADRKILADAALNAATKKGATYADVRIGRYLNQFIITREDKVENLVNTESYGAGVRVIADGAWGFFATDQLTPESIARAAEEAVAIAKANAKLQESPVQLAPQKGVGDGELAHAHRKERLRGADQGEDGPAAGRQRRRAEERGQLRQFQPLPGQRTEILRQHRRQLHRPGRAPHLAGVRRDRHRPEDGQVPDPPRAQRPVRTRLRVPRREARGQAPGRRHALHVELRHDRRRHRRRQAGA